jgi:hypothetical protein
MKTSFGFINTSLVVILGIGCIACVEQPQAQATFTSADDVLAARREMLSAKLGGAAAGRLDPAAFGAATASSTDLDIPGCEHVIELDAPTGSGSFAASASLSCEVVNEYAYLDVVAFVSDGKDTFTVVNVAALEEINSPTIQTPEIGGAAQPGQVLVVDSLALTMNLDEILIGYRRTQLSL